MANFYGTKIIRSDQASSHSKGFQRPGHRHLFGASYAKVNILDSCDKTWSSCICEG